MKVKGPGVACVPFPGGRQKPDEGELRVALDKAPYAEIIGHAVQQPDVEVCGVLVGRAAEDEHGAYVHVTAAIRGEAARQEGAAVTFTHETWNHIHGEMDRRFPDQQIVGWYHTHGGFGVFLSEMDTFVHDNFFREPHHLAYVYDPLAGSEAIFHRREGKLEPARRYWLGGRERKPAMRAPETSAGAPPAVPTRASGPGEHLAAVGARAGGGRGGLAALLPWAVAGAATLALLLDLRPAVTLAGAPSADEGPVAILQRDPVSGVAVGIPLELLEPVEGVVYRDRRGALRLTTELRGPGGVPLLQPGLLTLLAGPQRSEAEVARLRQRAAEEAQQRSALLRMIAIGAGAVAVLGAAGLVAWHYLSRRA